MKTNDKNYKQILQIFFYKTPHFIHYKSKENIFITLSFIGTTGPTRKIIHTSKGRISILKNKLLFKKS